MNAYDINEMCVSSLSKVFCNINPSACFCPQVLLMAMKDMNIAKLTSADLPLFNGITQDLFPAVETPVIDYGMVSLGPCPVRPVP